MFFSGLHSQNYYSSVHSRNFWWRIKCIFGSSDGIRYCNGKKLSPKSLGLPWCDLKYAFSHSMSSFSHVRNSLRVMKLGCPMYSVEWVYYSRTFLCNYAVYAGNSNVKKKKSGGYRLFPFCYLDITYLLVQLGNQLFMLPSMYVLGFFCAVAFLTP